MIVESFVALDEIGRLFSRPLGWAVARCTVARSGGTREPGLVLFLRLDSDG